MESLSGEVYRVRVALNVSEDQKDKLKARLAKLRATGATLSKLSSDEAAQLRTALRRSRCQKAAITSFGKENAPAAQDRAEVGEAASVAGGSACQTSCNQEGA